MALIRLTRVDGGLSYTIAVRSEDVEEVRQTVPHTTVLKWNGDMLSVKEDFEEVVFMVGTCPSDTPHGQRFVHYTTVSGCRGAVWVGAIESVLDAGDHRIVGMRDGRQVCVTTPYDDIGI